MLENGDFVKIEQLDEKTIRILLSAVDLEQMHLTYEEMDYSSAATKRAVSLILQRIRAQTDLPLDHRRLLIEAFPESSGGCILYLNLMDEPLRQERHGFDTPLVFGFDGLDPLVAVSGRLLNEFSHLIVKTELYLDESGYRLLLYTYCRMEKRIIQLLQEYGTYLGKGAVLCAFVKEHAKPLLTENAVESIVTYLG